MLNYIIEGDLVNENYGLSGEIISKFDHVINVKTEQNKGFAVTDSKVVLAPYHIKVPDYIFKKILDNVDKSYQIKVNGKSIKYKQYNFEYDDKSIFKGKIRDCSSIEKGQLITITEKVIKEAVGLGSLDDSILNYPAILSDKENYDLSVLQQEFYKKLANIIHKKKTINDLLGLGIGLTPTGDDFIVGYLSALEANLIEDKLKIRDNIDLNKVFDKTTRVSALHLKAAIKHRYNEKLVDLYKNIDVNEDQYINYAKRLIKVGNSSGLDMLTGLYFGLIM